MKKKEILKALEERVSVLERNGNNPLNSWATTGEKLKELEARAAEQRQGIHSLLRRIETLEIQFREKIELSAKLLLANKKALLTSRKKGKVK